MIVVVENARWILGGNSTCQPVNEPVEVDQSEALDRRRDRLGIGSNESRVVERLQTAVENGGGGNSMQRDQAPGHLGDQRIRPDELDRQRNAGNPLHHHNTRAVPGWICRYQLDSGYRYVGAGERSEDGGLPSRSLTSSNTRIEPCHQRRGMGRTVLAIGEVEPVDGGLPPALDFGNALDPDVVSSRILAKDQVLEVAPHHITNSVTGCGMELPPGCRSDR